MSQLENSPQRGNKSEGREGSLRVVYRHRDVVSLQVSLQEEGEREKQGETDLEGSGPPLPDTPPWDAEKEVAFHKKESEKASLLRP